MKAKRNLIAGLFLLIGMILGLNLNAMQVASVQDGFWNDPATWSTARVPGADDQVIILHAVVRNSPMILGDNASVEVNSKGVLTCKGALEVRGVLKINGTLEVTKGGLESWGVTEVYGSLIVSGDIEVRTGLMKINGNARTDQDLKVHPAGFLEMNGEARVQGDLNNWGTTSGDHGMIRVCGDANHNGTVENVVYLCMECEGAYTDAGIGTFVLNCTPFPVTFLSFDGVHNGDRVNLAWVTASEMNTEVFIVERAVQSAATPCTLGVCTGVSEFMEIGRVPAAGNSSSENRYTLEDPDPSGQVNFYRIKVMDLDGGYYYSEVIEISEFSGKNVLEVYPNPNNDVLYIRLESMNSGEGQINLYDIQGRKVWDRTVSLEKGAKTRLELQVRGFAAGTYIVEYRNGNEKLTKKVIFFK